MADQLLGPDEARSMIPTLIHQLWIDPAASFLGSAPLPPDVAFNSDAWCRLHPDFEYKLWKLDDVISLARLYDRQDVCVAVQLCRFPAMKADIARLFLLEFAGGFWIDLKLHPRKRFLGSLIENDLVVTEHFPKDNLPEPNGFLCNGLIGARPNHPCIQKALNISIRNVRGRMDGSIFYVTGAPVLIEALRGIPDKGRCRMLDHEEAWRRLVAIRGGSYNKNGKHWSERQEYESAFNEQKGVTRRSSLTS